MSAAETFPQDCVVRCVLKNEQTDITGRKIVAVSTELPDHVETISGLFIFDLLENQFA
jgi:hypothetical protein